MVLLADGSKRSRNEGAETGRAAPRGNHAARPFASARRYEGPREVERHAVRRIRHSAPGDVLAQSASAQSSVSAWICASAVAPPGSDITSPPFVPPLRQSTLRSDHPKDERRRPGPTAHGLTSRRQSMELVDVRLAPQLRPQQRARAARCARVVVGANPWGSGTCRPRFSRIRAEPAKSG
jgi:hypothetical protein